LQDSRKRLNSLKRGMKTVKKIAFATPSICTYLCVRTDIRPDVRPDVRPGVMRGVASEAQLVKKPLCHWKITENGPSQVRL